MSIRLIDVDETVPVQFDTPIALVRADERYPLTVYGTTVLYRRLPVAEATRIVERSQRARNGLSSQSLQRDLELQYILLDWQGLEDTHGQPVACPIPITETLLHALPHPVREAFTLYQEAAWPEGEPWEGKEPATLIVRRILSQEMDSIRAEQTIRGSLQAGTLWRAVVQRCLKSWSNVYDGAHLVPLDDEARERLPLRAVFRAFQAIVAAEVAQEAALGNFATPSSATSPMAGR
jgi:hypothetical protein